MIVDRIIDFDFQPVFARVSELLDNRVDLLLKLEGLNPGGSIKMKPAIALIRDLEARNILKPGFTLIDTTSGNMGIALAMLSRSLGYRFVCVTDEKITKHNSRLIRTYGAELVILENSTMDERYEYIRSRLSQDDELVWTRQFQNTVNPLTHETTTAREILHALPKVDHLFIGVGTGGTLAGCSRLFSVEAPGTRIVAVDAEGSSHFVNFPAPVRRRIPGIGATQRSPFIEGLEIVKRVIVPERSAISACDLLLDRTGWLLGGSSGSVLSAILSSQADFKDGDVVVGICADFGERYLEGLYDERWREEEYEAARFAI